MVDGGVGPLHTSCHFIVVQNYALLFASRAYFRMIMHDYATEYASSVYFSVEKYY